jgi:hypothetical protein
VREGRGRRNTREKTRATRELALVGAPMWSTKRSSTGCRFASGTGNKLAHTSCHTNFATCHGSATAAARRRRDRFGAEEGQADPGGLWTSRFRSDPCAINTTSVV